MLVTNLKLKLTTRFIIYFELIKCFCIRIKIVFILLCIDRNNIYLVYFEEIIILIPT